MEVDHAVSLGHQGHQHMMNELIDDDNGTGEHEHEHEEEEGGEEMPPSPTRMPGGLARSK